MYLFSVTCFGPFGLLESGTRILPNKSVRLKLILGKLRPMAILGVCFQKSKRKLVLVLSFGLWLKGTQFIKVQDILSNLYR